MPETIKRTGETITWYGATGNKLREDTKDGTTFFSAADEEIKVAEIGSSGLVLYDTNGTTELVRINSRKVEISDGSTYKCKMDYQYFQAFVSGVAKAVLQAARLGLEDVSDATKDVDLNAADVPTGTTASLRDDIDCPSGETIKVLKTEPSA
jgi:hypothetical protein